MRLRDPWCAASHTFTPLAPQNSPCQPRHPKIICLFANFIALPSSSVVWFSLSYPKLFQCSKQASTKWTDCAMVVHNGTMVVMPSVHRLLSTMKLTGTSFDIFSVPCQELFTSLGLPKYWELSIWCHCICSFYWIADFIDILIYVIVYLGKQHANIFYWKGERSIK